MHFSGDPAPYSARGLRRLSLAVRHQRGVPEIAVAHIFRRVLALAGRSHCGPRWVLGEDFLEGILEVTDATWAAHGRMLLFAEERFCKPGYGAEASL